MAPSYKITYFDFTGRAEAIRLIFSYAGIPFEDKRISQTDWPKFKPTTPFGQMPILEVDGEVINQSVAICRYVAKQAKLAGQDDIEDLKIDAAVDNLMDVHNKLMPYVFEKDESKKKALEESINETTTKYYKQFEENAKKNGGFFAINRISWADIVFITEYELLRGALKKNVLVDYPTLTKIKDTVLKNKGIRSWIENRKETRPGNFSLKEDL